MTASSTSKSKLHRLAKAVRDALIEAGKSSQAKDPLSDDDRLSGCCAVASDVLAEVFRQNGLACTVVCGEFWRRRNAAYGFGHCWVEAGDFIVDVTPGQFFEYWTPVFVLAKDSLGLIGNSLVRDKTILSPTVRLNTVSKKSSLA